MANPAMAVPAIDALVADVAAEALAIDGAIVLIKGFTARLDAAVAAALAGGATAAELVPLTDLSASIKAKTQELSDAVTTNTPAAGQPGKRKP